MKRAFDLLAVLALLALFSIPMLLVAIAVRFTSTGSVLYWSSRVGRDNRTFLMPKFRTMKEGTPVVATHLLKDSSSTLTSIGGFLRSSSLDELPQLWCVLKGEMSLVGPRPALYNQYDLIELRTKKNVHSLLPGITGWAQVNGRDELSIDEKVSLDADYLKKQTLSFNLFVLWLTVLKVLRRSGVRH